MTITAVLADDERPARAFLSALLKRQPNVTIVGEAADGAEAVQLIEARRPDVAFLDLQMPDVDGLSVVRLLKRRFVPLVVFVTAYDEFAVKAFELNAVDYLTKPVTEARLKEALRRVADRLGRSRSTPGAAAELHGALRTYDRLPGAPRLERLPVRKRDDILLLPVAHIASVVADGELLHVTTAQQERHTISYRLKELEARLDPARFIRLSRGALVNIDQIVRITPMPGGLYTVRLKNGQELDASRIQSRVLRTRLLQM